MATITYPDTRSTRLQAVFLRGHLRLMAVGMTSRGLTKTQALKIASGITGKKYKRGEHELAAEDITTWLKENPA